MGLLSRAKRYLPKNSITVALLDRDVPMAFGVVENISEAGACIITNAPLARDRDFRLKLSFYRAGMLAANGRVVWSAERKKPGAFAPSILNGVEFKITSNAERQRLQGILESPEFSAAAEE